MKLPTVIIAALLAAGAGAWAQPAPASAVRLSLDSCRTLAVANNKALLIAQGEQQSARHAHQAARTNYLPRIAASGAYLHSSRELSLLSGEQKQALGGLGSTGAAAVEALRTDTRNAGSLGVMLTQPLYMGGKIRAYDRITRFAEQAAAQASDLALQQTIVEVDEAYWQIVGLRAQRALAEGYLELVGKLDDDLTRMVAEGVATTADALSVKVKVNEAEVALIQVDNGLELSRMLLCELCGLPLSTPVDPVDLDDAEAAASADVADVATALARRPELRQLSLASSIANERVALARADYRPSVALAGGYVATNPSLFNSFERHLSGMWTVGVVVNVPLVTFGERSHKVKAAKADAATAALRLAHTREQVELQVAQGRQKVQEAQARLMAATRSQQEADENLRHAQLGFQEGVIPVSDLLTAQTAWLGARSALVAASIDLRLARLYLLKSTGSITVNS